MIVLKSSSDHPWPWADAPDEAEAERRFKKTYPTLHAHLKNWEEFTDAESGKLRGLRHRLDHGRFWWELRPCSYYEHFSRPRIVYQAIQFYAQYSIERGERFGNNKTFFLETDDAFLAACLNSPIGWYLSWRHFIHLKDEALSNDHVKIIAFPVPKVGASHQDDARHATAEVVRKRETVFRATADALDWLRHEFGLERSSRALSASYTLDSDGFVAAVRASLPKSRKWTAAEVAQLRKEYTTTIEPARKAAAELISLERILSDLVNTAYGLTPEEVVLMWRTAPPRMPLDPSTELARMS
jgi:hypothetical protein